MFKHLFSDEDAREVSRFQRRKSADEIKREYEKRMSYFIR